MFFSSLAPFLAFPVTVALLTIWELTQGSYGHPHLPWLIALWATFAAAWAWGYLFGVTLGQRWFTAPLAGIVYFGMYVVISTAHLPYGVRSLFPVLLNRDTEFAKYLSATMLGQAIWFTGLAILSFSLAKLIALHKAKRQQPLALTAAQLVATLAIAVPGALIVVQNNGQYLTGYNHRDFECRDGSVEICLNVGYAAAMPGAQDRFTRLSQITEGTNLQPSVLEQNVEGIGDSPSPGARSLYLEEVSGPGLDQAVIRYVEKYGGFETCWAMERSNENVLAIAIVNSRIAGFDPYFLNELHPQDQGFTEWSSISSITDSEFSHWLVDHEDKFQSCTLQLSDLP